MKLRTLLTILTAASLGLTAFAAEEETPLSKQMSIMNKSLRTLKRQLPDGAAKKDDNLVLIGKVKSALDEAKSSTEEDQRSAGQTRLHQEIQGRDG